MSLRTYIHICSHNLSPIIHFIIIIIIIIIIREQDTIGKPKKTGLI